VSYGLSTEVQQNERLFVLKIRTKQKKKMKNITLKTIALVSAITILIAGCKKDEPTTTTTTTNENVTGAVTLKLEHEWGMTSTIPFELDKWFVHPMTNDSLKLNTLKYYVSNIQLKKSDGTWWAQDESYYLADLSLPEGNLLKLTEVPEGTYVAMKYTLGVDSIRNISGAQSGALSTSNNMFWSWNNGYIMMKAEGESPQSSDNTFTFHLGGFKGVNNVVTVKETNFNGATLDIAKNAVPMVHISSRPNMLWHSAGSVSGTSRNTMPNAAAKSMADDYFGSFQFDHIHN